MSDDPLDGLWNTEACDLYELNGPRVNWCTQHREYDCHGVLDEELVRARIEQAYAAFDFLQSPLMVGFAQVKRIQRIIELEGELVTLASRLKPFHDALQEIAKATPQVNQSIMVDLRNRDMLLAQEVLKEHG